MYLDIASNYEIRQHIAIALNEDIREGDHSSLSCIPADKEDKAVLRVKENGILAGMALARVIITMVDPDLKVTELKKDGDAVVKGDEALYLQGRTHSILKAERLVLNYMQRLSGIATVTRRYCDLIKDTSCRVLDTRKTTPGLRLLEKWAVAIGGGTNHRVGLYDMIMLKDNHIDAAGGIQAAITKAHTYRQWVDPKLKIEVETRSLDEVKQVLATGLVDRIMLDNFTPEAVKEAVALIGKKYETEASGGITFDTLKSYAETGVDFISVGALTHSVKSLDLSLKILK